MFFPTLSDLIPVIQISVGPVILISGVGLLLLSMTNRLGRVIDRARILHQDWKTAAAEDRPRLQSQLRILWVRGDIIRRAIFFSSLSVLLAACLIITLFLASLFQADSGLLIAVFFIGCLVSLVVSLVFFLWDVNKSLDALQFELKDVFSE